MRAVRADDFGMFLDTVQQVALTLAFGAEAAELVVELGLVLLAIFVIVAVERRDLLIAPAVIVVVACGRGTAVATLVLLAAALGILVAEPRADLVAGAGDEAAIVVAVALRVPGLKVLGLAIIGAALLAIGVAARVAIAAIAPLAVPAGVLPAPLVAIIATIARTLALSEVLAVALVHGGMVARARITVRVARTSIVLAIVGQVVAVVIAAALARARVSVVGHLHVLLGRPADAGGASCAVHAVRPSQAATAAIVPGQEAARDEPGPPSGRPKRGSKRGRVAWWS